jgi:hypothetical protein
MVLSVSPVFSICYLANTNKKEYAEIYLPNAIMTLGKNTEFVGKITQKK